MMLEESGLNVAPVNKRILSALLDYFLFWVILTVLGFFFGESERGKVNPDDSVIQFGYSLHGTTILLVIACWILMFPVFEGITGYTPAKRILGLEVLKRDYTPASTMSSFIRHLFDPIDVFFLVGFIIASNNSYKQRIGDKVANTIVVEKNKRSF